MDWRPEHDLAARTSTTLRGRTDRPAVLFEGRTWTWGMFAALAEKLEGLLRALALSHDVPIGLVIRNRPAHLGALWALMAARRPAAFINPFQAIDRIAAEVLERRFAVVLADREDWANGVLADAVRGLGAVGVVLGAGIDDSAVCVAGLAKVDQPLDASAGLPGVAIEMLTGGTTGAPKRIPLRYDTLGFAIHERYAVLGRWMGEAPADDSHGVLVQYGPVAHLGGLFSVLQAGVEGRPLVLLEKFEVEPWRRVMRQYRPRLIGLPPAQMRMVLDAGVPPEDLRGIVAARCGNAALDRETRESFQERYGIVPLSIYGSTEFCGPVAGWSLEDRRKFGAERPDAVGRVWPHISRVRIMGDAGQAQAFGQAGRLEVQIPSLGPQWQSTNDIAVLDEEGFLTIKGRADNAINRGGFKIVPAVVEDVLRQHPAVADVIVLGLPDARLGEVPVAAVECRAGQLRPDGEALKSHVRAHLAAYCVPVRILVLDSLPRTPALKVSRQLVAELLGR